MIKPAAHLAQLKNYKPGKTVAQIVAENNLSEYAVLWNNENPIGASEKARQAVHESFKKANLYPDPFSTALRTKLAERLEQKKENLIVGNGSEGLIMNILKTFCEGEDSMITSSGSFVIIYIWAKINKVPLVQIPILADYRFDLEGILNAIDDKTKIIYLANANNPTGTMITKEELSAFMAKVPPHILVVVDEAYYEFSRNLNPDFPNSIAMQKKYVNLITLRTFSKAYGIAAARIGYGIAHEELIEYLMNVKLVFEPAGIAQAAGLGALEDADFLKRTLDNNQEGIHYYYQEFNRLGLNYTPSFTNFVMLDFKTEERVNQIFQALMKQGVFVRPLGACGLPHCLRISIGLPKENTLCIRKLEAVLT